jgi:hypothetical protein
MHHNYDLGCGLRVHDTTEDTAKHVAGVDEKEQEDDREDEDDVDVVVCVGRVGGALR